MEYVEIAIKLIIGLSILNVWLLRANKATPYRGGEAKNIKEEFANYGLSETLMKLVGGVKVALAIALIASIWFPVLELYSAAGIAVLMLGAVSMHLKIGDPVKKMFPAATFLILSVVVIFI